MKTSSYLFIVVISLLITSLAACSSGNVRVTDQSITEKIKIGKTSKNEVSSLLGDAQNIIGGRNGKETWMYYYNTSTISPLAILWVIAPFPVNHSGKYSGLTIKFTQDGIVEDVSSSTKLSEGTAW